MLFMIIEHFDPLDPAKSGGNAGTLKAVGDRFKQNGRMLPDGVVYVASWMEASGDRCYQLMEAPDRAALDQWIDCWRDLVRFDVEEVLTSADFWERRARVT